MKTGAAPLAAYMYESFVNKPMPWWLRFQLFFCMPYYASDGGRPPYLIFKKLRGNIYLIKEIK